MNFMPLTLVPSATIVDFQYYPAQYNSMAENQLKALEQKIDELIALCNELNRENQALKSDNTDWQSERLDLIEKNELARNKVAAMIDRLRTME